MKKLLQATSKIFFSPFLPSDSLKGEPLPAFQSEDSPLGVRGQRGEKNAAKIFLKSFILTLILLSGFTIHLYAQDDEVCGMDADDAWGGDTAAMHKFLASCGRIDTVNVDEHSKPVKAKPHHQTIKMVLNSGKVLHSDSIFFLVEKMPQFPGGDNGLFQYLKKYVVYPALAHQQKIQGRVYVEFIVERDGSVSHVKVTRGIGGGCDQEAVRVVAQMPKWAPGKMSDNPVRVQYTLPVKFTL